MSKEYVVLSVLKEQFLKKRKIFFFLSYKILIMIFISWFRSICVWIVVFTCFINLWQRWFRTPKIAIDNIERLEHGMISKNIFFLRNGVYMIYNYITLRYQNAIWYICTITYHVRMTTLIWSIFKTGKFRRMTLKILTSKQTWKMFTFWDLRVFKILDHLLDFRLMTYLWYLAIW